jgi:hypothetical protein
VTIPARVKGPAVTPTKLTKKLFSDGVGGINEGIFKCSRYAPGGGTFTVTIDVSPAGAGTLKMLAVTSGKPRLDKLKPCIEDGSERALHQDQGGRGRLDDGSTELSPGRAAFQAGCDRVRPWPPSPTPTKI